MIFCVLSLLLCLVDFFMHVVDDWRQKLLLYVFFFLWFMRWVNLLKWKFSANMCKLSIFLYFDTHNATLSMRIIPPSFSSYTVPPNPCVAMWESPGIDIATTTASHWSYFSYNIAIRHCVSEIYRWFWAEYMGCRKVENITTYWWHRKIMLKSGNRPFKISIMNHIISLIK